MMWNSGFWLNSPTYTMPFPFRETFVFILVPFLIWSFVWKGWALWRATKNGSKPWFIALLLVNTLGILEILYIFVFGKEKGKSRN